MRVRLIGDYQRFPDSNYSWMDLNTTSRSCPKNIELVVMQVDWNWIVSLERRPLRHSVDAANPDWRLSDLGETIFVLAPPAHGDPGH
jgi:hypothetical protein